MTPVAWILAFGLIAARWNFSLLDLARGLVGLGITQVVPGAIIWRAVRPRLRGAWSEDVAMGLAIGGVIAAVSQALGASLGLPALGLITGPAAGLALMAAPSTRDRVREAVTTRPPWWMWPATTVAVVPLLIRAEAYFRTNPIAWGEGFTAPYLDMPFHLALVAQLAHRGPSEIPYVLGEPLAYHWLGHAWIAQTAAAGGLSLEAALHRLTPIVVSVGIVAVIAAAATRMSARSGAGPLAAILALLAGDLDLGGRVAAAGVVDHRSPNLGLSNVLLVGALLTLSIRWSRDEGTSWTGPVLVLLVAGSAATKGSAVPVLLCGLALAALVAVGKRSPRRSLVVLDLVVVSGVLCVAFLYLYDGGSGQLSLDPLAAIGGVNPTAERLLLTPGRSLDLVALAAVVAAVDPLARGAPLVLVPASRPLRWDPMMWTCVGTALAGAATQLLFTHPGGSQHFFLRNAAAVTAVGSAVALVHAVAEWPRDSRRRLVMTSLLAGVTLTILVLTVPTWTDRPRLAVVTWTTGIALAGVAVRQWLRHDDSGRPRTGTLLPLVLVLTGLITLVPAWSRLTTPLPEPASLRAPDARGVFSADQVEAARWLRDHTEPETIVATNRHCGPTNFARCDSRRFYVAAYTERRVLVEGWAYTRSWAEAPLPEGLSPPYKPFWDLERLQANDAFFADPNPRTAARLWQYGVRWVFVDRVQGEAAGLSDVADVRHETRWARIAELHRPDDL